MRSIIAAAGLVLMLAGCGGGGNAGTSVFGDEFTDRPDPPSTPGPDQPSFAAEGRYVGTTSSGYDIDAVVLETGDAWAVYSRGGTPYGLIQASGGAVSGGRYTATGFDYYLAAASRYNASIDAAFTSRADLSGTLVSGTTSTFAASYDSSYEQPASLTAIAGTWTLSTAVANGTAPGTVSVAADGTLTGTIQACNFTGLALPRTSGKNVFDVRITFADTGCLYNSATLAGIAVLRRSEPNAQITIAALLPDKSSGFLAFGQK
jgi:hypothetical protein